MKRSYLFLFLVLFLYSACEESSLAPFTNVPGQEYFPLELGKSWFYQVDSVELIPIINGTRYDSTRLEARETLLDTFQTADGQTWYRGERWERVDATQAWQFKQTFALTLDNTTALRQEDNLQFTKLVFPARVGESWDGHTAFDEFRELVIGGEFLDVFAGWEYSYATIDEPFQLSIDVSFEQVLTVQQAAVDNLLDLRDAYERYAAGVGLVERFIDARHTQCRNCCNSSNTALCLDLPWDEKAEKGFILRQVLTRYE